MSMLRPLLIIGVGGSGGKTIRAMKQALTRKLEAARYEGGIPAAWQFLHIDVTYDGVEFPPPMLRQDEFHCVVPRGVGFEDILMSITNNGTLADQQSMLAGWGTRPPPINLNVDMSRTMQRAVGRQVGVADSRITLQAIQGAIAKMSSPTVERELGEVAKVLGATPHPLPQAFIISSLAGGSGAGMFMDVAELLQRGTAQNWTQEAVAFLYTPEVFSSIGSSVSEAAKNSLGVMNELIASKWVGLSERSELLYSKLGLVARNNVGEREYGCKTNYLIGARNDVGVDIRFDADGAGMNEVFLTFGEALADAVSNDEISDFLYQITFISRVSSRPVADISGLAPESVDFPNPTLAAAGIGFGQMTLGADRIVDYVADSMTRAQIEQLLWPEFDSTLLKKGASVTVVDLIQEKSDQVWPKFLIESGLDQRGSENQIIDALLPDQLQELIKQFVVGLIKKSVTSTPIPIATFSRAVWSEWEYEFDAFLESLKSEMSSKSQVWVPEIQEKIQNLVAHELAQNGYVVLSSLTKRLETELREHVIPELMRDHTEFANALSGFDQRAFDVRLVELADGLTGVSTQNGPFLGKLSSSLSRVLEFHVNSYVSNLAASLIEDMLNFFIEPLKNRLVDSGYKLQMQRREKYPSGSSYFYPNFPVWGSGIVPNRYKPRALERILIDFAEYESTYEFYAGKDTSGAPPFQQSVGSSLLGKKMNPMPGDRNEQTLITASSRWTTSVRDAQGLMGSAVSKADWKFHTDLAELSENNRRWLKSKESSFGKFTDMSIRGFVSAPNESQQVREAREAKFVKEYAAMLKIASPLVLLNPKASAHIVSSGYGGSAYGIMLKSSKIPFAMSSDVGEACIDVLKQQGHNPNTPSFAAEWFDAGSNASTMSAVATHMDSLPAWAFESLTEPILEQVAQSKNSPQTWKQFWDGRRSRPLVEAIPFETEMRRSIITGWFIARLFGMSVVEGARAGHTVKVWNPTLEVSGWSTFPNPLLPTRREDGRREWVLPQLLVSAGIALAEFGKSGDPEFIYGYRLLKYLGREVTTTFNGRDHWDGWGAGDALPTGAISQSTFIKDWVITGRKPNDSLEVSRLLQSELGKDPDRRAALIATVEKVRAEYAAIWVEYSSVEWQNLPETWELKEDIDLALSDIIEYVKALHEGNEGSQIA